ncbi:MAG: hypothetical protein RIR26_2571 [Pseudomonadota bacterium]|jgi:UPF0755 protein
MLRAFFGLVLLLIATTAGLVVWSQNWWTEGWALPSSVEFEVREGSSLHTVAQDLAKKGLIKPHAKLFELGWRFMFPKETVKAGDYRFEGEISPARIATILGSGQTVTLSFTIPEGLNIYQIAERLENVFPKVKKQEWLAEMRKPDLLGQLPENPPSVEGFLFPETYTFNPRVLPREVLNTMIQTSKKFLSKELISKGSSRNLSPLQIVTLASIIEKETGRADERPHISSVFHNRLRIGMRLQTDPTVIYGIWERYDGNIRKEDLRTPTPYNTYVISGLPPGPIASPGFAALQAAVDPIETDDLYFVSRGDGSHIFSSNLKDHQKGVYQYQIRPARLGNSQR